HSHVSHRLSLVFCSLFALLLFSHTATTEIYTLSLHDALPIFLSLLPLPLVIKISLCSRLISCIFRLVISDNLMPVSSKSIIAMRSEEHTSELQSRENLVCRLLLEKKN